MHIRADTGEKIVDSWQFLSEGEEFDGVWSLVEFLLLSLLEF